MKKIYLALLTIPFFFSCDDAIFEKDMASTDPMTNFEYMWTQCDEKYSYFDLKNIDWDQIKTEYAAKISNDMSEEALFTVLGDMLTELRDDHTNLVSDFNISFFGVDQLGQDNYDARIVKDQYLSDDYYISGPFIHDFLANKEVGYIRFGSFTGTVDDTNLDFILNRYKNTKGLILDLRENGGGAVTDVFSILSRFVEKETILNYSRIKTGPAHDDFSDDEPVTVKPYDGIRYTNKVMVLTDRGTYSAGSFTSLATKALPNMILVGDTTGGGLGLPNGGQLPNGWTYRFSITQALTLDKSNAYENGVPPDIAVSFDWTDRTKDEIIERALLELL